MVKWMRGAALLGVLAFAACDLVDPVLGVQDAIGVAEAKATTEVTAAGAAAAIKEATELLIKDPAGATTMAGEAATIARKLLASLAGEARTYSPPLIPKA